MSVQAINLEAQLKAAPTMQRSSCPLSSKQLEIIKWLSLGKTARDISEIINRSRFTVQDSIDKAKQACGAANTTSLVAMSLRGGWIK